MSACAICTVVREHLQSSARAARSARHYRCVRHVFGSVSGISAETSRVTALESGLPRL